METREFIKLDMSAFRSLVAENRISDEAEVLADKRLLHYASRAMEEKLEAARKKGRGGWWNPDECSIEHLHNLLHEHVKKGDMVDVMNFAAMIYARECADLL